MFGLTFSHRSRMHCTRMNKSMEAEIVLLLFVVFLAVITCTRTASQCCHTRPVYQLSNRRPTMPNTGILYRECRKLLHLQHSNGISPRQPQFNVFHFLRDSSLGQIMRRVRILFYFVIIGARKGKRYSLKRSQFILSKIDQLTVC